MLKQYQNIKAQYNDCILFFRLGDFYEMFGDDAQKAAPILDVVLTARASGKSGKIPMCGIPYHAASSYITRLIKAGLKVAICEQTENPAEATGIVKREVTRVITAGTFIDQDTPEARYLASVFIHKQSISLAFTQVNDGVIHTSLYPTAESAVALLSKHTLSECIFAESQEHIVRNLFRHPLLKHRNVCLTSYNDFAFNIDRARTNLCQHFEVKNLSGFGIDQSPERIASCGALLEYMCSMNRQPLRHIYTIQHYNDTNYLSISPAAHHGLELQLLVRTLAKTQTGFGKRQLTFWIHHPLKEIPAICQRQNAIRLLSQNPLLQEKLQNLLKDTPDIEKNLARISCGYTHPKDFLALRNTLVKIPQLQTCTAPHLSGNSLFTVDDPISIRTLLEKALNAAIPISNPGGQIIAPNYHAELDQLRSLQENGRTYLKQLQQREIARTKINSLKVGFNKVFGYYFEISRPNLSLVPADYIRKQTLVNAERFITPELKEFEEKMLSAETKVLTIEQKLLQEIQLAILNQAEAISQSIRQIATLDALLALSKLGQKPGYTMPIVDSGDSIDIQEGRHPLVEDLLDDPFIPNDTSLDCNDHHCMIITGPNMAGKSTYIRQVGLLVIMAQIGSFIPAKKACIGLVDKIFTRIGAQDDITKGQSTFMVEMSQTAEILHNLTPRSLVILDEIGRGTSTYDGLSLAWAISEYVQHQKVRTLFATHFHELTALSSEYPGVKNYNVAVKEWGEEIVFLHKITEGASDDSYGIYVAKLAGIPKSVVQRAKKILMRLELCGNLQDTISTKPETEKQISLFHPTVRDPSEDKVIKEVQSLDPDNLTPLDALSKIQKWKEYLETNAERTHSSA